MNVLLDTCAFLWWITADAKVSPIAKSHIRDPDNIVFVSAASGWEIATKYSVGKLSLPGDPPGYIAEQIRLNSFLVLPISMAHSLQVYSLPFHHKDPFDRILVSQSQLEGMPIITADPLIGQYAVTILW